MRDQIIIIMTYLISSVSSNCWTE